MAVAVAFSSHHRDFLSTPEHSYSENNQSSELQDDQWRELTVFALLQAAHHAGLVCRKILRDVGPTLSPDDELGDIAAAEGAVNAKDAERSEVVDGLRDELRRTSVLIAPSLVSKLTLVSVLTRQHQSAAIAAQRPASHPTPSAHDAQVRSLEQQQYAVGKQLNEEQAAVAKKEVELGRWRGEREEVGKKEVGEDGWVDGKIIRLKILSEAGFSLIPSGDDATPAKVLIRNDAKSDVHTVRIDNSRSKVYNANLIWGLASD